MKTLATPCTIWLEMAGLVLIATVAVAAQSTPATPGNAAGKTPTPFPLKK